MPLYKQLEAQHADSLARGTWRVSRLAYLARAKLGPLSDPDEGILRTVIKEKTRVGPPYSANVRNHLAPVLKLFGDKRGMSFKDCVITMEEPEFWVLSLTQRSDPIVPSYEAAFEILDADTIAHELQIAATTRLGDPVIREVIYLKQDMTLDDHYPPPLGNLKPSKFSSEEEVRILWPEYGKPSRDVIFIDARRTAELIRRIR